MLMTYRQGGKSYFEVGEANLEEGGYFIIFWGAYAIFSPSCQMLGGVIAPVVPPGFAPMHTGIYIHCNADDAVASVGLICSTIDALSRWMTSNCLLPNPSK